jgi:hypothetical protein
MGTVLRYRSRVYILKGLISVYQLLASLSLSWAASRLLYAYWRLEIAPPAILNQQQGLSQNSRANKRG